MGSDDDKPKEEEVVNPPLTPLQIKMAKIKIEELHPIAKTSIGDAYPGICCCVRLWTHCCGKEEMKLEDAYEQAGLSGNNVNAPLLDENELRKMGTNREKHDKN